MKPLEIHERGGEKLEARVTEERMRQLGRQGFPVFPPSDHERSLCEVERQKKKWRQ